MAKVNIVPCMAYDAICFLECRMGYNESNLPAEEIEIVNKIKAIAGDKFGDKCFGMSSMCLLISAYIENKGIEFYTLDDLINLLSNFDGEMAKSRITNEFLQSFMFQEIDIMTSGGCERLNKQLQVLKEIGFEEIWKTEVLPKVQIEVGNHEKNIKGINFDKLFSDIQTMKNGEPLVDINIYVSYFSYPVAFTLYNGSFLTCKSGQMDIFSLTAHELMHGFMTDELRTLYLDYVNGDEYLTEQHRRLIEDMHSGDEEEFVMAAEYYLCFLHGRKSKEALLDYARKRYNACCPTSAVIFNLLMKKRPTKVPANYAAWLIERFKAEQLPQKDVEAFLDIISPPSEIESYTKILFASFRRIIAKIEAMQKEYKGSFIEKLEEIVGEKFTETTEKSVEFGQMTIQLPRAKKVSVIQKDRLFINVAEFEDYTSAMLDRVTGDGNFISPTFIEVKKGEFPAPPWFVYIGHHHEMPVALAATFVKDNIRVTVTQRTDVTREADGGVLEVWIKNILVIKNEILAAQDIVESIMMQL